MHALVQRPALLKGLVESPFRVNTLLLCFKSEDRFEGEVKDRGSSLDLSKYIFSCREKDCDISDDYSIELLGSLKV